LTENLTKTKARLTAMVKVMKTKSSEDPILEACA
jgi:hypothetical protein